MDLDNPLGFELPDDAEYGARDDAERGVGERRSDVRADADFTLTIHDHPEGECVQVKDVSRAGVCCLLEYPMPAMTQVAMLLHIPLADGEFADVACEGAVVRCDRNQEVDGGYEVAIFFINMEEDDRVAVNKYVRSLLDSSQEPDLGDIFS